LLTSAIEDSIQRRATFAALLRRKLLEPSETKEASESSTEKRL
jgi:hypothetical protein